MLRAAAARLGSGRPSAGEQERLKHTRGVAGAAVPGPQLRSEHPIRDVPQALGPEQGAGHGEFRPEIK